MHSIHFTRPNSRHLVLKKEISLTSLHNWILDGGTDGNLADTSILAARRDVKLLQIGATVPVDGSRATMSRSSASKNQICACLEKSNKTV